MELNPRSRLLVLDPISSHTFNRAGDSQRRVPITLPSYTLFMGSMVDGSHHIYTRLYVYAPSLFHIVLSSPVSRSSKPCHAA